MMIIIIIVYSVYVSYFQAVIGTPSLQVTQSLSLGLGCSNLFCVALCRLQNYAIMKDIDCQSTFYCLFLLRTMQYTSHTSLVSRVTETAASKFDALFCIL